MLLDELRGRLTRAAQHAGRQDIDTLLVSPGPDLRYLTGYAAVPLDRLTCLIVSINRDPLIIVPVLEKAAALASPIGAQGIEVVTFEETDDVYALVAKIVGRSMRAAVDDRMWAVKALALRTAMPNTEQLTAGIVLGALRMRKSDYEIGALKEAGRAIDHVHSQVPTLLRIGRTEREVANDIAAAIIDAGHVTTDFVIVGSGPNGASPHHEVSDRVINPGDPVVVDIGGTMPSGYCSDSTRVYSVGEPDESYQAQYEVLLAAQQAATAAVRPGVKCEDIDASARNVLAEAGLAELFIHRLGHGIGLETHEDPYMVAGNKLALEPGMAFSIEPGFYQSGKYGARIEDIVVCGPDGAIGCNNQPRELVVIDV